MINPADKPISAFPAIDTFIAEAYIPIVDPTETDPALRNKKIFREKILDYILTQITTGENIPEYDPEAIYHYGISPVFVRYTINGIRRIWSLKDTENTNTFETRLAPSYADNSQWLDVGLDVDPNGRIDLNFEIIPYAPALVVPFNELRPKKLIGLEGNTAITNAGTNGESQGIYLFIQDSTGGHTVTINGTVQSINPEPGKATVISWMFDGVNYQYSSNYVAFESGNVGAKAKPYIQGEYYEFGDFVTQYDLTIQVAAGTVGTPGQSDYFDSDYPPFNSSLPTLKEAINWYFDTMPDYMPFSVLATPSPFYFADTQGLTIPVSFCDNYIVNLSTGEPVNVVCALSQYPKFFVQPVIFKVEHPESSLVWDSTQYNNSDSIPALPSWAGHAYTIEYKFIMGSNGKMDLIGSPFVGGGTSTPAAETLQTLTDNGTTVTLNATTSTEGTIILTGNRELIISNLPANVVKFGTIEVYQNNIGGHTLTLPAGSKVINGGAGAMPLTATPNALDLISWRWNGSFLTFTKGPNYN